MRNRNPRQWKVSECMFCRRRAMDLGNGMKVVCKRHKNRKADVHFVSVPFVIAPSAITLDAPSVNVG